MLLAMPFSIAAILNCIAAMLPLLHHCDNAAIARGIAAMPFAIAATPQYFPDVPLKLRRRWMGSFSITKAISLMTYWLDLPLTWWIHLIFHIFNLKRFHQSEEFKKVERPPSLIMIDDEEEFDVEAILKHKGIGA